MHSCGVHSPHFCRQKVLICIPFSLILHHLSFFSSSFNHPHSLTCPFAINEKSGSSLHAGTVHSPHLWRQKSLTWLSFCLSLHHLFFFSSSFNHPHFLSCPSFVINEKLGSSTHATLGKELGDSLGK